MGNAEKTPKRPPQGTGLDENTRAALSYLLGWITGIVILLTEKDSKYVKYHAMQSTITFLGLTIIIWVLSAMLFPYQYGFWGITQLIWILAVILWLVLMIKAYQGEAFKLPVIGDIAADQVY